MATARMAPEVSAKTDYNTWLRGVSFELGSMQMPMEAWQQNWGYDFRREYDAGMTVHDAAVHAHDFWWGQLLAECWT